MLPIKPTPALRPRQEPIVPDVADSTRVSVIIPALNEEEMIGRCLGNLAESHFPASAFEVVLVDNGSTDRTVEVAESFASRLRLTILRRPGVTISALRNLGAAAAKGNILAFLDADCLVPPNWLELACSNLASEESGVIGGYIDIPKDSRWVARAWYRVGYAPKNGVVTYVPSGNMLVRRTNFLRIGGFNEALKTSEDCELCFRAREAGMTVRAVAEMVVVHLRTPQTLAQFYHRERWHGTHVAKVFFANVRAMANARAVMFAVYVLACEFGIILGLVLVCLSRQFLLLGVSSVAFLAGPLAIAVRKLKSVHGRQFWLNLFPLTLLHTVWGLARARSLLSIQSIYPRKFQEERIARSSHDDSDKTTAVGPRELSVQCEDHTTSAEL
jgi:glycosyltransferase involved in cell wall biosynthesis